MVENENWFEQFDWMYTGLITADILKDSFTPDGKRLTTFLVQFPRIILPEVLTHRAFSRNTASNRAKPTSVTLREIDKYPFVPAIWLAKNKGMQSFSLLSGWWDNWKADFGYNLALKVNKFVVKHFLNKVSKQQANRLLEPFQYTTMVITTSHLDNFFNLRDHEAAQFEIQVLARKMREAFDNSVPTKLYYGEMHLPYILPDEEGFDLETKLKISVARCARNSYAELHPDILRATSRVESDIALFNRLLKEKHLSPFEHQALSVDTKRIVEGNLGSGWQQLRWYVDMYGENAIKGVNLDLDFYKNYKS